MSASKGTILVTGANGGLGCAIVSKMIGTPEYSAYHGVYTVRDTSSATKLRQILKNAPATHAYDTFSLNLAKQANVRDLAATINARVAAGEMPPIRALVLNAGLIEPTTQTFTEDGFDMTFAANYLGHWLLTLLLLQSIDRNNGRIIVISSSVYDPDEAFTRATGHFREEKWRTVFQDPDSTDPVAMGVWSNVNSSSGWNSWHSGQRRYGASKLCLVMMIAQLQHRLDDDPNLSNISVLGLDPGTMPTDLVRRTTWIVRVLMFKAILPLVCVVMTWLQPNGFLRTTSRSASDVMTLALEVGSPLCDKPKGWYMGRLKQKETSVESRDKVKQRMLWTNSVRYTKLAREETSLVVLE